MTVATKEQKNVEIAFFSKAPRSNAVIELLRLIALFILIINHFNHIGFMKVAYLDHLSRWSSAQFSVSIFIAITGIFTIGKGKDYFLRNFSRILFVIVAICAIFLPLFLTIDMNVSEFKVGWERILWGGRDGWYLWAIAICSIAFPFIKLDKFIQNNRVFSLITTTIVFVIINTMRTLYGWEPFVAVWVLVCGVCSYSLWQLFKGLLIKNKNLYLWCFSVAFLLLSSVFTWFSQTNWMIISPIAITFIVLACASTNLKTPKWLNVIVRNSYYIYETHFIFQCLYALYLKDHYHQFAIVGGSTEPVVYFEDARQYWECFGFVLGASMITSTLLSQIQTNIWEKYIAKNVLYIYEPFSKGWWILIFIFTVLFWLHFVLENPFK